MTEIKRSGNLIISIFLTTIFLFAELLFLNRKETETFEIMASGRKFKSQLQHMRSVMGPCLVIFGLPLTIPGTAITIVPFYDETGFSKYGGLHIMGFFILFLSIGFIGFGCFLNCTRKATISPLEQVHLVSPWGTPRHHNLRSHPTKEELIPCTDPSDMT